jgi:hypothetical protein
MGGGRTKRRAGLLMARIQKALPANFRLSVITGLLLLLCRQAIISAQEGPGVEIRGVPAAPLAGSTWTLSLLVDHPAPEEVDVLSPSFPESLLLDRFRKGPSGMDASGGSAGTGGNRTLVEYRFTTTTAGSLYLGIFTVITPRGRTQTGPLSVTVRKPEGEIPRFFLVWEGVPPVLRTGEAAVFSLRMSGRDSLPPAAGPELFTPAASEGFIIESERLTPEERTAGLALRLKLIPLAARSLVLPARTVSFGNAIFEVPALRLPVYPAQPQVAHNETDKSGPALTAPDPPPAFPEFEAVIRHHPVLFKLFRSAVENTYAGAKGLWEQGRRAEALAMLRQRERDHPAGSFFSSLRKQAELSLGLTGTRDETWRDRLSGHPRSGVMKQTEARRIPDPSGEITADLNEGRPIKLSSDPEKTGGWVRVITNDEAEKAGWVLRDKIVLY